MPIKSESKRCKDRHFGWYIMLSYSAVNKAEASSSSSHSHRKLTEVKQKEWMPTEITAFKSVDTDSTDCSCTDRSHYYEKAFDLLALTMFALTIQLCKTLLTPSWMRDFQECSSFLIILTDKTNELFSSTHFICRRKLSNELWLSGCSPT